MIPVTLVKLDNYSGFLGTFDNISWWKTEPLPDAIDYVNDAIWVYGQYHVCSAKLLDGTYSIYRSSDNGYSWETVKSGFTNIYCLLRVDYGIVIASTNDGWWRSTLDSGKTWSKISSEAPNCLFARELNSDILVALDTHSVWRSTNGGVNWTKIKTFTETITYPAIDGTTYDLILGVGKTMYYSDDAGTSWYNITGRMTGWPSTSTYSAITDIEMTKTFSKDDYYTVNPKWNGNDNVPCFVVQILLPSGVLRHYYMQRTPQADGTISSTMMFTAVAKFDAPNGVKNSLTADESRRSGSEIADLYILFSGTDSDGNPMLKSSTNGGFTWNDSDISNVQIYTGPDLSQISTGMSFLDDVYFTASWAHGAYCHNYWSVYAINYVRNQSYDMDMILGLPAIRTQSYTMDILNVLARIKTFHADVLFEQVRPKLYLFDALFRSPELFAYSMDVLNQKANLKQYTMDTLELKVCLEQYTSDVLNMHFWTELYALDEWVQKTCLEQFNMDIISVFHFTETFLMDSLLQKVCVKNIIMDILQEGLNNHSYSMDIKIQDTIVGDILHNTERYHWQGAAIGIGYPRSSYPIFDSRKETKT